MVARFTSPAPKYNPVKSVNLRVEPNDVVGSFGSGMSGQLEGTLRENSDGVMQPYISYGRFGQAWLTQVSNSSFKIKWDSDVYQIFLTDSPIPEDNSFFVEFLDINSFEFTQSGFPIGGVFVRNITLQDLPEVPWEPDTCGPSEQVNSRENQYCSSHTNKLV